MRIKNHQLSYAKLIWAKLELLKLRDQITPEIAPGVARKIRSCLKSVDGAIRNADRFRPKDPHDWPKPILRGDS